MTTVTLDRVEDIATITIDDGKKNVINHGVLDELEAAFDEVEASAKAVVLTGREGSFCAGYDISVMTGDDPKAAGELGKRGGRLAHRLYGFDRPIVGLSRGHTFTIGALWLACCDHRIAERGNHKYGMTEVALNVPFSPWPLAILAQRLAPEHHVPALLHSRIYDPDGAQEAGFVDELVDAGTGLQRAQQLAAELAQLPAAYGQSKRALRREALAVMAADLDLS